MQINLLKKVVENTAGVDAVRIVDLLFDKKDVNEFLIAKKLNLTINQTRNLLYRLSHLGIINSIRKKDKRKGWYIYFWTFNVLKSLEVLADGIKSEIASLNGQLTSKKQKRFYKCKLCGREVNEESALLTDFICSECGEVYDLADNTLMLAETVKQIEKLEKELAHVDSEIAEEQGKKDKKLAKLIKKGEVEKKKLRDKNREERKKLKKKEEKNNPKKTVKKSKDKKKKL
jgi:transcription factor E